jgi:hypothetical protein
MCLGQAFQLCGDTLTPLHRIGGELLDGRQELLSIGQRKQAPIRL